MSAGAALSPSTWTDEREYALAALWKIGMSAKTIANVLGGLTESAVYGKVRTLGLPLRRADEPAPAPSSAVPRIRGWTEERVATLKHLYAESGLSCSQIAKKLGGVSRNAVIGKIHRLGLVNALRQTASAPPTPRPPKPPPKPKAVRMPRAPVFNRGTTPLGYTPDGPSVPTQEPTEGAKTLLDLERHECRWAVAGDGAETLFCCKPVWWKSGEATPWCPTHYRRAYDLTKRLQPPNVYDPSVKRTAKPDPVLRREVLGEAA